MPNSATCLADTIYFEARGEGNSGMLAAAFVVYNRTMHRLYPKTVCEVVHQKGQFSWIPMGLKVTDQKAYNKAMQIAEMVLAGIIKDPTNGATHFHVSSLEIDWSSDNMIKIGTIGAHTFYKRV